MFIGQENTIQSLKSRLRQSEAVELVAQRDGGSLVLGDI